MRLQVIRHLCIKSIRNSHKLKWRHPRTTPISANCQKDISKVRLCLLKMMTQMTSITISFHWQIDVKFFNLISSIRVSTTFDKFLLSHFTTIGLLLLHEHRWEKHRRKLELKARKTILMENFDGNLFHWQLTSSPAQSTRSWALIIYEIFSRYFRAS